MELDGQGRDLRSMTVPVYMYVRKYLCLSTYVCMWFVVSVDVYDQQASQCATKQEVAAAKVEREEQQVAAAKDIIDQQQAEAEMLLQAAEVAQRSEKRKRAA